MSETASITFDAIKNQIVTPQGTANLSQQEKLFVLALYAHPQGVESSFMHECLKRRRTDPDYKGLPKAVASNLAASRGKDGRKEIIADVVKNTPYMLGRDKTYSIYALRNPSDVALQLNPYGLTEADNYYLPYLVPLTQDWQVLDFGTNTIGYQESDETVSPTTLIHGMTLLRNPNLQFRIEDLVEIAEGVLGKEISVMGAYDNMRELKRLVPEIIIEGTRARTFRIESGHPITYAIHKPGFRRIHL